MIQTTTVPALETITGLVHGFEQRLGPNPPESREDGRRRVRAALSRWGRLFLLKQVHGATVRAAPWEGSPAGDAGIAQARGLFLGVETADCLPILIVDPRRRAVAAVHAGWRGTAAGVARATVEALASRGSAPAELIAAVGPGIGPCCYEVGDELREAFGSDADGLFRPGPRGRPHLDVRAANVRQLEATGLASARIHHVNECTYCNPDRYHSYRREGRGGGRMISFVGFSE
jgi:YfiH family protein